MTRKSNQITVPLSREELDLVLAALDSHEYWQLSEPQYRSSGYVLGDGSDDDDAAVEIRICRRLQDKLQSLIKPTDEARALPAARKRC